MQFVMLHFTGINIFFCKKVYEKVRFVVLSLKKEIFPAGFIGFWRYTREGSR